MPGERGRPRWDSERTQSDKTIGPLERRVLDWLWARGSPASVRDLQSEFPTTAYTTLLTTLDRLYRKGLLQRAKTGRAFQYRPSCTRDELASRLARQSIERLIGSRAGLWRPVLSTLVESVSERDETVLDELERLIREHRESRRHREEQP